VSACTVIKLFLLIKNTMILVVMSACVLAVCEWVLAPKLKKYHIVDDSPGNGLDYKHSHLIICVCVCVCANGVGDECMYEGSWE